MAPGVVNDAGARKEHAHRSCNQPLLLGEELLRNLVTRIPGSEGTSASCSLQTSFLLLPLLSGWSKKTDPLKTNIFSDCD